MGTVARHNHVTDNVKSEGVQKVSSRLVRRKQNLPVSESAKALAKRKETSPAVSTVEAVLLSAKLCSFRIDLLHQTEGVFLPLPCIQPHSEALASPFNV
jgi:hypothetical protein